MPELPEVQTIISDLNKKIKGDTIVYFWSDWGKAIKNINGEKSTSSADKLKKKITNREILGARRIGKNIFIDLSGGKTLYIHLKMTGHLLVKPKGYELKAKSYFSDRVNQYIHHIWTLKTTNKEFKTLEFSDLRKFGKIVLDDTQKINNLKEIQALGIDAMSPKFTFSKFEEILNRKKKTPIGIVLMDQELIAGIGNIYRSEILFEAGVLPQRKVESLRSEEKKKIYDFIKKVLEKAIESRGTSDSDYRDTDGAPGSYQKIAKVYRREKQKCPKCDTIIKRETLGQRSVFICPVCQK
jgi:formamidopyrimidine-DNA glycosylase